jgi:hypothetical protein
MRRTLSAIFVASSVAIAAAQGQQPAGEQPGASPQQPATERPAAPRPQGAAGQLSKTTISGCIQSVPPAAASAPEASKFELARAKMVTPAPVGTSSTATAARYRLEGEEKLITTHLNQQVEITGTVSAASGGATTPMLKVESVKMVAATCPTAPAQ